MRSLSGRIRRACFLVAAVLSVAGLLAPGNPADASTPTPAVVRYAAVLRSFNPALSSPQARDIATHVLLLAGYYDLDPRLLVAIVGVESNWRSSAVSASGAQGLGQLMPATADGLSVLAFDAYENLDGTARYLRRLMQQYAGLTTDARYRLALAGYNAGAGAVARFGGIPPYPQTQTYVQRVMRLWHRLQATLPAADAPLPTLIARARPHPVPTPRPPGGSVAGFTALEAQAWARLAPRTIAAASPALLPARPVPGHGLRGWLARAFRLR